jgi:hypothetical protein
MRIVNKTEWQKKSEIAVPNDRRKNTEYRGFFWYCINNLMIPWVFLLMFEFIALPVQSLDLLTGIHSVFHTKQAHAVVEPTVQTVQKLPGTSGLGKIVEVGVGLEVEAFMRAAVKNTDIAAPFLKEFSKGATEAAIDNPRMVLKIVTSNSISKILQKITLKFNQLIESTTKLVSMVPDIPKNMISDQPPVKKVAHTDFLLGITNSLENIGKGIASINKILLIQANGIGLRLATKSSRVMGGARLLGSKAMKDFLIDPKSFQDESKFITELVKENPVAMEKLNKAQHDGMMEIIDERTARFRKAFLEEVNKLAMNSVDGGHSLIKRDFDLVEFKNTVQNSLIEFDQIEEMLNDLK